MAIDRAMWGEWLDHPVTDRVMQTVGFRVRELEETLGRTAGKDQYSDAFLSGQITAYRSVLYMEPDDA